MPEPLDTILAVCSLLHEAADRNSATRQYHGEPVLRHTLEHLDDAELIDGVAVLCWDDQTAAARQAIGDLPAQIVPLGPRTYVRKLHELAIAQSWADGWRGGLLSSVPTDAGFHPGSIKALVDAADADALLLVDPASAFLDEELVDQLIAHARAADPEHCREGLYFMPAAPGLTGLLLRHDLIDYLAERDEHPGRLLAYRPEAPRIDPVAADWCCHGPTLVARTLADFRLRSDAQITWAERHLVDGASAEALCTQANQHPRTAAIECTIEPTTRRHTQPIWVAPSSNADLSLGDVTAKIDALATDDIRLTFGGRGDPLCWPHLFDAIAHAHAAGITQIHVETDLLTEGDQLARLLTAGIDVLSVHLPAMTAATYASVTGTNRMAEATHNLTQLILAAQQLDRPTPVVVPTFIKLAANVGEMEAWYDQWLAAAGSAVLRGPDTLGHVPPAGIEAVPMLRTERAAPETKLLAA